MKRRRRLGSAWVLRNNNSGRRIRLLSPGTESEAGATVAAGSSARGRGGTRLAAGGGSCRENSRTAFFCFIGGCHRLMVEALWTEEVRPVPGTIDLGRLGGWPQH